MHINVHFRPLRSIQVHLGPFRSIQVHCPFLPLCPLSILQINLSDLIAPYKNFILDFISESDKLVEFRYKMIDSLFMRRNTVKRHIFLAALAVMLNSNSSTWAQQEIYSDVGSEKIDEVKPQKSPFSFSAFTDVNGKAKINKGFFKGDKFQFGVANGELSCVYYYSPQYEEAANAALAYTETYFGWKENPWFDQTHFHTVTLSLGGITKRFNSWTWRGLLQINYDGFEKFDAEYFNYNIMLWGRYELFKDIGVHMGFFAETGMRMDRIYPIIGFDWKISERWKLNAVFPFDMALQYLIAKHWTIALAGRTFDSRHRVRPHESHSRYVVRYTNFGLEAMLKYEQDGLSANIHAGVTTGGKYRIANAHNHHPHNYHVDPSGYIGALVESRF